MCVMYNKCIISLSLSQVYDVVLSDFIRNLQFTEAKSSRPSPSDVVRSPYTYTQCIYTITGYPT